MSKSRTPSHIQVHVSLAAGVVGSFTTLTALVMTVSPANIAYSMAGEIMVKDLLWMLGIGSITLSVGLASEPMRLFLSARDEKKEYSYLGLLGLGIKHNLISTVIPIGISVFLNVHVIMPHILSLYPETQAPWIATTGCAGIGAITAAIFCGIQCLWYSKVGGTPDNNGEIDKGSTRYRIYTANNKQRLQFYGITVAGISLTSGLCAIAAPFLMTNCFANSDIATTTGVFTAASIAIITGIIIRYTRELCLDAPPPYLPQA